MSALNQPMKVVAVAEAGPTQQQVKSALSFQDEFALVDLLSNPETLSRDIRAAEANIVLIDQHLGGESTLDIIDELAQLFPESAIVAILDDADPLAAQQVMLAGARAFIIQPFTQMNLLSTLRRVRDLETRRQQVQPSAAASPNGRVRPLQTLAVYSPRGGAGGSTLAANLALALREESGEKTLLLEGKLFFGHLNVLLNLRARNNLADLVPHASALEEPLVRDVVVEHISGLHILLGPSDIQVAQGIRPQDLYNIFLGLQRFYPRIIIDAGSQLTENTVTLLDAADRILLVATPDLASLHDVSRFIPISHSLGYPANKLLIVLNREGMPGGIKTKDIQSVLRQEIFVRIPEAGPEAVRSLNRGVPLLLRYPRNPTSQALQRLAKQIARTGASGSQAPTSGRTQTESKRKTRLASY